MPFLSEFQKAVFKFDIIILDYKINSICTWLVVQNIVEKLFSSNEICCHVLLSLYE